MYDFEHLLTVCSDVASEHPGQAVFIGGIAAFMYIVNSPRISAYAETTHDGDFYVSFAGLHELRDTDELVSNKKLRKHSFTRSGVDFDVYSQYGNGLIVPFEQIAAYAVSFDGVDVAAIEHLFVLKLDALIDRTGSSKGGKDVRDLACLSLIEHEFRAELLLPYLRDEHIEMLSELPSRSEIVGLAKGNVQEVKVIRNRLAAIARIVGGASLQLADPALVPNTPIETDPRPVPLIEL